VDLRYPQKVPEDSSVTTDSIADGSITNDKLAEPVSVANGGTGKTTAAEGLAALGGASLNGSSTVDFNTKKIYGAGSNNSAPTYSFSGDTDTGIYSSGPDLLGLAAGGVSGLVTSGGDTAVGAGVDSRYKLKVFGSGANVEALKAELAPTAVTTTEARYLIGIQGVTTKRNISATATDTGYLRGLMLDSYIQDDGFQGGLTNQYGAHIITGINAGTGTITNSYGLYLGLLRTTGTIVNAWGLYQDATTARNYFAGRTLIGTNTDDGVSALQVAGGGLRLVGGAAPATPAEGTIYFNSTDKHFYGYNGTAWVQLDN
jgi:hypothetical protein